jgi:hypothetical protein
MGKSAATIAILPAIAVFYWMIVLLVKQALPVKQEGDSYTKSKLR